MIRLEINGRLGTKSNEFLGFCEQHSRVSGKIWKVFTQKGAKIPDWHKTQESWSYERQYIKFWASAVFFGTATLEGFIYEYAATAFSDTYVKNYLDKLNHKSKWVIIPKIVTGKEFPTNGQPFQHLCELIQARDSFIHPKSSTKPTDEDEELDKWLDNWVKELIRSHEVKPYETVIEVLQELRALALEESEANCWWKLVDVEDEKK
jgi:hypothetical protein